jgi:hypothetical protein
MYNKIADKFEEPMPAAKLNLTVEQEATYRKRLIWRDKNRRVINLGGYTGKMQIRETYTSNTVLYELSTVNGRMSLSTAGVIELNISSNDTASLKGGVYDIVLTAPDGTDIRLAQGKLMVSPAVTKD